MNITKTEDVPSVIPGDLKVERGSQVYHVMQLWRMQRDFDKSHRMLIVVEESEFADTLLNVSCGVSAVVKGSLQLFCMFEPIYCPLPGELFIRFIHALNINLLDRVGWAKHGSFFPGFIQVLNKNLLIDLEKKKHVKKKKKKKDLINSSPGKVHASFWTTRSSLDVNCEIEDVWNKTVKTWCKTVEPCTDVTWTSLANAEKRSKLRNLQSGSPADVFSTSALTLKDVFWTCFCSVG